MSKAVKRIWENDKELYKLFFVLKCKNRKIKDSLLFLDGKIISGMIK